MNTAPLSPITPKTLFLLPVAVVLMGQGPPSCTPTTTPLSTESEGFIDENLEGLSLIPGAEFRIVDENEMHVIMEGDDGRAEIGVWSTRIGENVYLNYRLDPEVCIGCDQNEIQQLREMGDAFMIFRYATRIEELVDREALNLVSSDDQLRVSDLAESEEDWLVYSWMNSNFATEAIQDGRIEGILCDGEGYPAVISSQGDRLRTFLVENDEQLFSDWVAGQ